MIWYTLNLIIPLSLVLCRVTVDTDSRGITNGNPNYNGPFGLSVVSADDIKNHEKLQLRYGESAVSQLSGGQMILPSDAVPVPLSSHKDLSSRNLQGTSLELPNEWQQNYPQICMAPNMLAMSLQNSILKDNKDRQGYVASNMQLQFDNPPQSGALVTRSFGVSNGVLVLGTPDAYSNVFYTCGSGDFDNLYWLPIAKYCQSVVLRIVDLITDCPSQAREASDTTTDPS